MGIGQKICAARKNKNMTGEALGAAVGVAASTISKIENEQIKGGPDRETLVKISDALGDRSILLYALLNDPICKRIIPRAFAPLNNTRKDPLAALTKFREEIHEADEAAKILERIFSHADPSRAPAYKETLFTNLEQIIDVTRAMEEMIDKLKTDGALTDEEHLEVYIRQQAKCERNGHHKSEIAGKEVMS